MNRMWRRIGIAVVCGVCALTLSAQPAPPYNPSGGGGSGPSGCTGDGSTNPLTCPAGFKGGDGTGSSSYQFPVLAINGANYIGLFGQDSLGASYSICLPAQISVSGQVLVDSGTTATTTLRGGGAGPVCRVFKFQGGVSISSKSASTYTVVDADMGSLLEFTAAVTVTLPRAGTYSTTGDGTGGFYAAAPPLWISCVTGPCTVNTTTSTFIGGGFSGSSLSLTTGQAVQLTSDSTNWHVLPYSIGGSTSTAVNALRGWCAGSVTGNGTFLGLGASPSSGACAGTQNYTYGYGSLVAHACTLGNLYIQGTSTVNTGTTVTVYDNGTATSLTCSISGSNTTCNDTTHHPTAAAGDSITVGFTSTGGFGGATAYLECN